jgi:predicted dehydrogenase
VRKVRFFSSESYISVDTKEQEVKGYRLNGRAIEPIDIDIEKKEPLRAELESFLACAAQRTRPLVAGEDGLAAVKLAKDVAAAIERSVKAYRK